MGNYYEGELRFGLIKDIPKDILHDLKIISNTDEGYLRKDFLVLQNEKWGKHERFDYPKYNLSIRENNGLKYYLFWVNFCMKGYRINGDDLGQDIYDFLIPYIDKSVYDMQYGGYIGRVKDEDCTYDKTFFVDYKLFDNEVKNRSFLCNNDCYCYIKNSLCQKYNLCKRAYLLGMKKVREDNEK